MKNIRYDEGHFYAYNNERICYFSWHPTGRRKKKGILVVVHGQGEHGKRYKTLVDYFVPKGYVVYSMDRRGHGISWGQKGHVEKFKDYVDDLKLFFRRINELENNDLPTYLVGHSVGGLVVLHYLLKCPDKPRRLAGTILSSPCLGLVMKANPIKKLAAKLLAGICPTFSQDTGLEGDITTHDEGIIRNDARDTRLHSMMSARLYTELLRAMEEITGKGGGITTDCLFLCAGDDKVVSLEATRQFAAGMHPDRDMTIVYKRYYHEVFNEVGREKVFQDMENWLKYRKRRSLWEKP